MSQLNDLRRLAAQRHKSVTRKISRLKSGSGVEVSGSHYDPRQDLSFIRTASKGELNRYVKDLNHFNDRRVQFVPDANMKPIPRESWEKHVKAEAKKDAFVKKFYEPFKDIYIAPSGQTVDQRMAAVTPLHAHMGQRTTDSPYKQTGRASTSVYGEAGLKRLTEHVRKQATLKHEKEALANHKAGVLKMLDKVGNMEMKAKVEKLTQKQWAVLWKYTPFAANIKVPYSHYKDSQAGNKSIANSESVQTDLAVAGEYVDWAGEKDEKGRYKNIRGRL